MSYDLFSYIKYTEKPNFNDEIIGCFKKYGFDVKLHPEFELLNSSLFQPFVILKTSEFFDGHVGFDIETGCDLDIYPLDEVELNELTEHDEMLKLYNPTHLITSSARHSEFELITSSILIYSIARIYKGVFRDPQFNNVFVEERWYDTPQCEDNDAELIKYLESVKQDLKAVIEEEKAPIK